jgi:glutamate formiminotransferase / 5-formyltetrahydrofolate cyclo-ligase
LSPSGTPRLLAVPNVSEGRDEAAIGGLAHAFSHSAVLLDVHSDPDHNRTVLTLAPERDDLAEPLLSGARAAIEGLDLAGHEGEHPHIGVLDVCPVVFLAPEAADSARAQALEVARGIADLDVPVFLYGALASAPERRERAYFRRGGPAELARRMASGELTADLGPRVPHPSAGATLVTARPPLAAFNLELEDASLDVARKIAARLREAGSGLPGVRAIGLELSRGRIQVSTNVHDPVETPLATMVDRARELAAQHNAAIVAGEIVGLVPAAAMEGFPADLPLPGFEPARGVIEERLRDLPARDGGNAAA